MHRAMLPSSDRGSETHIAFLTGQSGDCTFLALIFVQILKQEDLFKRVETVLLLFGGFVNDHVKQRYKRFWMEHTVVFSQILASRFVQSRTPAPLRCSAHLPTTWASRGAGP